MGGLTIGNWIAVAALFVSAIGMSLTSANYLTGLRERQRNARKSRPQIRATINSTRYEDGWRSVQLHVVPVEKAEQNFQYERWRIERASVLRPKNAILARAADDDYASGVFFPEHPVRVLEGKVEGRLQLFALEFFIKFLGGKIEQKVTFKVTFSHTITRARRTEVVSAAVPPDAMTGLATLAQ